MDADTLFEPAPPPDKTRLIAAHEHARAFYRRQLLRAQGPRGYLRQRGFAFLLRDDAASTAPWHLGYAPAGPAALVAHLAPEFAPDELLAAGLATLSQSGRLIDRFQDRIMFPIHDGDQRPIAFIARAAPHAHPDVPKYLNSSDSPIFRKGHCLFGLGEQSEQASGGAPPVIVEGPLDAIAVWRSEGAGPGWPGQAGESGLLGLATCGTGFTHAYANMVAALPGARSHGITVAFDADTAGARATVRAWRSLSATTAAELHAAALPPGADPASLHASAGPSALVAALSERARPLAHAVIDAELAHLLQRHPSMLQTVDGRVAAARALADLLSDLPAHQLVRLAPYLGSRTAIGLDALTEIITDVLTARPSQRTPARANLRQQPPASFNTRPTTRSGPTRTTNRRAALPPPMPGQAWRPSVPPVVGPGRNTRAPRR